MVNVDVFERQFTDADIDNPLMQT